MKKVIRKFAALGLSMSLALSLPTTAQASINEKTVTETNTTQKTSTCAKAAKTQTKTVSSSTIKISGTDSLNGGYVTGKYTGTKKTVVTDHFTKGKTTRTRKTTVTTTKNYVMEMSSKAKQKLLASIDANLSKAWTALGFVFLINAAKSRGWYLFQSKERKATVCAKFDFEDLYVIVGYFLSCISGNSAASSAFQTIYQTEKNNYKGANAPYAKQNANDFFALCVREYYVNPKSLKKTCSRTYAYICQAIAKVTDSQIAFYKRLYGLAA